jgi:N-acetylglucosamine-6-phosphate deacetylase
MSLAVDDLVAALGRHPGATDDGATVLGFHLEGPFLSPAKPGAHRLDALVPPEPATVDTLLAAGPVDHITIAPEVPGAVAAIRRLREAGVVVSLGHSAASARETDEAIAAGANVFTHVFNAMQPLDHRDPGILGTALTRDDVHLTAIFDGVHLSREAELLLTRVAGDRIIAITDGTAAVGASGRHLVLGNSTVEMVDGAPRLPDGTIAGSALTMDQAFRNLLALGLDVAAASRATATAPATIAGLVQTGTLAPGSVADVAILDDRYEVTATYVSGRRVA